MAIEYKGGKCQICGYNKYPGALDLHHINGQKSFGIADKGYTFVQIAIEKLRQALRSLP